MDIETHAQIIQILDRAYDMTIATVRPDGFPQATAVAFVHDDLTLYFSTAPGGQKALNIAACDKVSLTVTPPYEAWQDIEGLSMAGHAHRVTNSDEIARADELLRDRFPEIAEILTAMPGDAAWFRVDPTVISLLDYTRGFGHAKLIDVQDRLPPAA